MKMMASLLAIVMVPFAALAQAGTSRSFADLSRAERLKEGQIVWIISDLAGTGNSEGIDGRFVELTESTIRVLVESAPPWATDLVASATGDGHTILLTEDHVGRIDAEIKDPLANGILIGAAVGFAALAVPIAIAVADCESFCFLDGSAALMIGAVGAGAGAAIGAAADARRTTRVIVYMAPTGLNAGSALSVAPIVTRERKGFLFTVSW